MLTQTSKCVICDGPLNGRQRKFCGRRCHNRYTNYHHQSYQAQKRRGIAAKARFVALKGNRCTLCGYCRNYAALEFHHRDPATKKFQLDQRSLANRKPSEVFKEIEKCILLCANCHAETHHPDAAIHPHQLPTVECSAEHLFGDCGSQRIRL